VLELLDDWQKWRKWSIWHVKTTIKVVKGQGFAGFGLLSIVYLCAEKRTNPIPFSALAQFLAIPPKFDFSWQLALPI
jgi:hypothetical protein